MLISIKQNDVAFWEKKKIIKFNVEGSRRFVQGADTF